MRLIDADALAEKHPEICSRNMKFNLDLAPTVDAVPVLHARWIAVRMAGERVAIQCSACKNYDNPSKVRGNYCWKCGARMDEKEKTGD